MKEVKSKQKCGHTSYIFKDKDIYTAYRKEDTNCSAICHNKEPAMKALTLSALMGLITFLCHLYFVL